MSAKDFAAMLASLSPSARAFILQAVKCLARSSAEAEGSEKPILMARKLTKRKAKA